MEKGRSGEERREAQHRVKESNTGKRRRVSCGCQEQRQCRGSGKEDEEEVRKKQGRNRTGRVAQACYHACFIYGCEP